MFAGEDKIKLGLERLARAGDDADVLSTALISLHGALEDRFRQILAGTPDLHESEHARILDVSRVQWNELIDLMRLYQGLSVDDAAFIRRMNRERQSVAHGDRYRGSQATLQRYAAFVLAFFPGIEPPLPKAAATPRTRQSKPAKTRQPAVKAPDSAASLKPRAKPRRSSKTGTSRAKTPAEKPAAPARTRSAPEPSQRRRVGLGLLGALLLILACVGLGNLAGNGLVTPRSSTQSSSSSAARLTTETLNMRRDPTINSLVLVSIPGGTQVDIVGRTVREDEREWVAVRYNNQDGWVDAQFLRAP